MPCDPSVLDIVLKAKELQNAMHKTVMNLLEEAERRAWDEKNRLQIAQDRIWELEQFADPDHDGHPYSDTLRT